MRLLRVAAVAALLAVGVPVAQQHPSVVLIVVDGLRPDEITPEQMPRLAALGERGIRFTNHHSVFPTVTRVNGSSMVTGVYPEGHGLLGNTIYIPPVNAAKGLDTGIKENLEAVQRASGRLLTAPTLGELLPRAGRTFMVAGSGSAGAAFVLSDTGSSVIAHQNFSRPPEIGSKLSTRLGSPPANALPNAALNRRAVDAYLTVGLDEVRPDFTIVWISDPDTTGHAKGLGDPVTRESLKLVDAEIGRVEDTLRTRGLLDRTNIIVASDHGFSTYTGGFTLQEFVAPFAKPMPDGSKDIVVAEGAVYLRADHDAARVAAIVAALQKRPEVGAIFTRPKPGGGAEGGVAGTLSYDVVRWNHARSGDILVASNWSDRANAAGRKGSSTSVGVAGHGTTSPYDVHATLLAAGPEFKAHTTSEVPTANVDLAPTVLRLLGVPVPSTMTGRAIEEGLRSGPAATSIRVQHSAETVKSADGKYEVTAHFSTAAGHRYFDDAVVVRR